MTFSLAIVWIAAIIAAAVVVVFFIQALWPTQLPAALEERALTELALLRDDLSRLRADTHRDRDELRTEISKHERAFVETTSRVNDCLREVTKLNLASSQVRR